ncbi:MAG: DUF721 domain-containing protein [Candidatus Omnitrophica bacterium]|nr:DUF721 domain-containing protein [Candidatus Omnitrophota bacterium]
MEQIKDVVSSVIKKLASSASGPGQLIGQAWQEAAGKKFIKHAAIENYKNGKLLVRVDSPVALFQLNLKRNQILEKLQKIDTGLKIIDLKLGKV